MRPILLVTGANTGVGQGICERILVQLSTPTPSDSKELQGDNSGEVGTPFHAAEGCTLILACRNVAKAKKAAADLERLLVHLHDIEDEALLRHDIPSKWLRSNLVATNREQLRPRTLDLDRKAPVTVRDAVARTKYRQSFCRNTKIDILPLDLASVENSYACADAIKAKYPYLTHMILNAGGASWAGINWPLAIFQMLTNLHCALTRPSYKLQNVGEKSKDGYGWVWQTNTGMHYLLVHELLELMRTSPYNVPSRIIWTGSLEANMGDYYPSDFQCLDKTVSPHPYESTKYQCELAALGMDRALRKKGYAVRAYTAHPGIVASSIFSGVIPGLMLMLMKVAFYVARWTFSREHPIDPYRGAIAASYVAIAPEEGLDSTVRYGARCTFLGKEYVYAGRVDGWTEAPPDTFGFPENKVMLLAQDMLERFDALLVRPPASASWD